MYNICYEILCQCLVSNYAAISQSFRQWQVYRDYCKNRKLKHRPAFNWRYLVFWWVFKVSCQQTRSHRRLLCQRFHRPMNLLLMSNVSSCSFLLLCLGKPLFADDSIVPCATQGCSFWWHIFVGPPWAAWNRYSWKHWNRATIYGETKHVLEQLSEICAMKCGLQIAKMQRPHGDQPAKPALVLCLKKQPLLLFSYAKHLKDAYSHSGQQESDLQWWVTSQV